MFVQGGVDAVVPMAVTDKAASSVALAIIAHHPGMAASVDAVVGAAVVVTRGM